MNFRRHCVIKELTMSYQVLAQKYRPQTFDEVRGQEVVTRTLKNSVTRGRIANAYIFCGPRGVGKTSVARLLSKTLNCEKSLEKSPCNKCSSCIEISQGISMDVLEIDGASNRGIDEIRTLRENVKFSPSKGKFRIYIIDEVHMLTQEAFNALLKTLEEPPSHVKFIFATTEPHKVIPTIMSRCQRFDFKKIPPRMIYDQIMDVAKKEKIRIDEKAALLIARSADGSLRDSLVILDQVAAFSDKEISTDDVTELLGMVHKDQMFELSNAVINNDSKGVARILDALINSGKDPVFITNSLIGHYRDLMILKTVGEPTSDMAFMEEELVEMRTQLEKLPVEEILYVLQNLSHCLTLMKGTMFNRAPLEITLIRLTKRKYMLSLPEMLARIEKIEQNRPTGSFSFKESAAAPETFSKDPSPKKDPVENPEVTEPEAVDFNSEKFQWKAVLNYVKDKKMSVFMFLNNGRPIEFSKNKVVIGFKKEHAFHKEALEAGDSRKLIEEAVKKVTGATPRIEFTCPEFWGESTEEKTNAPAAGEKESEPAAGEKESKPANAKEIKPCVEKAMDVFGGHVVRDIPEEKQ
ncbi:MAG: DNA polymerase III subunit gamma/tau [Candidatus Omnitrophota bacterium]